MADNQKLFAQMADLGRNINLLTDTVKKNTAATEGFISKKGGEEKSGDSTEMTDTLKDLNKTLKDVKKILESKPAPTNKSAEGENPKLAAEVKSKNPGFDFSKVKGGLKDVIKAFQEGGVAPKDGKYLVGENGPEVVKLPKGSGIVPVNIKDLISGLSNIPELSKFIKDDTIDYYGDGYSTSVVSKDGKKMDLRNLMYSYDEKAYNYDESGKNPDPIMMRQMEMNSDALQSLITKGYTTVNKAIGDIKSKAETARSEAKYDWDNESDYKFLESTKESIIDSLEDKDLYQNSDYTLAQADLIASQMLLDKRKSEPKDEFDKLGKLEDKSAAVINPKLGDKKSEKEEKSGGLFSKIGLKKKEKGEKTGEEAEPEKGEGKASMLLSKAGKFAENVAFGVAGKVLGSNLPGAGGMLAQKGLGALKKSIDNKVDEKKGTSSENKESKSSLAKQESPAGGIPAGAATLTSSVKKLSPQTKKEETKSPEQSETPKPTPAAASPKTTESKAPATKSAESAKTDTSTQSPLGGSQDLNDIKSALSRIASILEGPLTVSPLDSPFRPDSRRV